MNSTDEKKPERIQKFVAIKADVLRQTDKAVLFFVYLPGGGGIEKWMPRSQVRCPKVFTDGDKTEIMIPDWIAKKEMLI